MKLKEFIAFASHLLINYEHKMQICITLRIASFDICYDGSLRIVLMWTEVKKKKNFIDGLQSDMIQLFNKIKQQTSAKSMKFFKRKTITKNGNWIKNNIKPS